MSDLFVTLYIFAGLLVILLLNIAEIKRQTRSKWVVFSFVLFFPLILFIILLCVFMYPILMAYRMIISMILSKKCGNKFYGLLRGLDVVSATQTLKQNNITTVVIFETDAESNTNSVFKYLEEVVKETIIKNETHLGKLFTTLNTFSGYKYLEKVNIKNHECIRKLPDVDGELNEETFTKLISQWYFEPFNGPLLWDVAIGMQPLKLKDSTSTKKCYPMILRFHHVISDGVTLLKFLFGILSDKLNNSNPSTFEKYVKSEKVKFTSLLYYIQLIIIIIIYFPSALFSMVVMKSRDHNELHGKTLTNNEKVAFTLDENGTYFQKVKKIRKYTNASIPEIVLAAFSESLKEHFIKYHQHCPSDTTLAIPVVQNYTELLTINHGLNIKDIQLNNRFILICLKVPFFVEDEEDFNQNMPVLSKLNAIRRVTDIMKTSVEVSISKVIYNIFFGVLPTSLVCYLCCRMKCTAAVSLIPGPPKMSFGNGIFRVRDIIFWSPHLLGLDLMFGSLLYDNRLILSFNCDAIYMSDQAVAQEILENTYKYMDMLDEELELHQN